jgi:hypothetical protein
MPRVTRWITLAGRFGVKRGGIRKLHVAIARAASRIRNLSIAGLATAGRHG